MRRTFQIDVEIRPNCGGHLKLHALVRAEKASKRSLAFSPLAHGRGMGPDQTIAAQSTYGSGLNTRDSTGIANETAATASSQTGFFERSAGAPAPLACATRCLRAAGA